MKKTATVILVIIILIIGSFLIYIKKDEKVFDGKVLRIGAALPLTGPFASFGDEFRRGAEVAQNELNKNDEVVSLIFEDTALDPKKAVDAVNKLVHSDNIDAIFVSAYGEAAPTHHITDRKGIPMLVLWDSNSQLEAMGDKVFALGPWTPSSGEVSAEFVYNKGLKKSAIFGYVQEWSISVSESFKNKFISLGGKITASEFSNPDDKDYRTQLSKIIATNPDVVYITVENFLKGVKQLKEFGYKGIIITSDLLDNDQIKENPGLFDGVYGSQVADPEMAETFHYADLYKNDFNEDPKKILHGAWGYDAVNILYKAYTDASTKDITQGLYNLDVYRGASGNIKFDANGTSKTIPKIFVVKNGNIIMSN